VVSNLNESVDRKPHKH